MILKHVGWIFVVFGSILMSNFWRVHCTQVSDSGPHGPLVWYCNISQYVFRAAIPSPSIQGRETTISSQYIYLCRPSVLLFCFFRRLSAFWSDCKAIPAYGLMMSIRQSARLSSTFGWPLRLSFGIAKCNLSIQSLAVSCCKSVTVCTFCPLVPNKLDLCKMFVRPYAFCFSVVSLLV